MQSCFLCAPDRNLIFAQETTFYAMLGLGPIVEGFCLIATKEHIPSMLDLSYHQTKELSEFTQLVRNRLEPHYGQVVITEHGRVPPCDYRDRRDQNTHCYHAHRLVFPVCLDLSESLRKHHLAIEEFSSLIEARQKFTDEGEYLYYEREDGSCLIGAAPRNLVRQFFRYKVAEHIGRPELADWKKYPRIDIVKAAMRKVKKDEA